SANPNVVVGRDMLFEKRRVEPQSDAFWQEKRKDVVAAAKVIVDLLARFDGRLHIALVPDTIRIYADQVPQLGFGSSPKAPYYHDLMRDLAAVGAVPCDLESDFMTWRRRHETGPPLYRRDDHHWSW